MRVTIDGTDRSTGYQQSELEGISIELMASQGEAGIGSAPVPDDAGTQEPYAGQQFKLDVGGTVIVDGFVGGIGRDRNGAMGTRLVNHHSIADDNALLNGHRAVNWKRPAETDRDRILAFNTDFLGYLSLDTTWVLTTHTQTIPAKTYTSETLFSELQDDCGKPTGKELFIERRRLHWHLPTEGYVADIAIVEAGTEDYINTFTNMSENPPIRSKDPMDLAVDVLAMNSKGETASAIDSTAQTRHDSAGARHEVLVEEPDADTTLLATIAAQTLADRKAERITYEGEIGPMDASQVERIPVGCLLNVTDKVWGLTSSTQRIAAETIRYIHPDLFMVKVELGYPVRLRSKPPITSPPSGLAPGTGPGAGGVLPTYTPTYPSGVACTVSGTPYDYTSAGTRTALGSPTCTSTLCTYVSTDFMQYFSTGGANDSYPHAGLVGGSDGGIAGCTFTSGGIDYSSGGINYTVRFTVVGPGTLTANVVAHPGGLYGACPSATSMSLNVVDSGTAFSVATATGPLGALSVVVPDDGYCAHEVNLQCTSGSWGFVSATWTPVPISAPTAGQPVNGTCFLGDGSTATFTTEFPYLPGSLGILVNGLDWLSELGETDPTTGAGTLSYPPPNGSTVCPVYKAA